MQSQYSWNLLNLSRNRENGRGMWGREWGRWAIVGVGGCGSWWMVAVVGVVVGVVVVVAVVGVC